MNNKIIARIFIFIMLGSLLLEAAILFPLSNIQAQTLSVTLSANPSSGPAPLNGVDLTASVSGTATGPITYRFDCTNDGSWEKVITTNSTTWTEVDLCNYSNPGNYTAKVRVERQNLSFEGITGILVQAGNTLSVSLSANPSSGLAPLNNVDLTATVGGTATGPITYRFDCTNDGTWDHTITTNTNPYTAVDLCNYSNPGNYTAKVRVERQNLSFEGITGILVEAPTVSVTLSANPSSGSAPLNGVDLTASVSGTATGSITYRFDCTNDGTYEFTTTTSTNPYTAVDLCNYSAPGTFTARVRVTRQNVSAENTTTITATQVFYTLSVSKSGSGDGTITSSPAGINCGADCSENYSSGTVVTLSATPNAGSTFVGWSGACSGTGSCTLTMNSNKSVTANFNLAASGTLSCAASTSNTITLTYSFSNGSNVSLFRSSTLLTTLGSGSSSGNYTDNGLSPNTSYTYNLRNGSSTGSTLLASVTCQTASPTVNVSLSANPSSGPAPLNGVDLTATVSGTATGPITYRFDCTNDGTYEFTTTTNTNPYTAVDLCNYSLTGNYTARVRVERESVFAEATTMIAVQEPATMSLIVSTSPSSGHAPLNDVDIHAQVSGTATGSITYKFDCTNDGTWERIQTTTSTSLSAFDLCDYPNPGVYTVRVLVERGSLVIEGMMSVIVDTPANLAVDFSTNPSSGQAPLFGVDLIAFVSGTATGPITYRFDCTSDGTWERTEITNATSFTAVDLCNYQNPGQYLAKVKVERGGVEVEGTAMVLVF
jgi:hypothetical protein